MTLSLEQTLTLIPFISSLCLFVLRLNQLYTNQWHKLLHLLSIPLFGLFDGIQTLNLFGVLSIHCRMWYMSSMMSLWFARFIFSLEMFYTAYILRYGAGANPKKYIYRITTIFILCLISILTFSTAIPSSNGVCIPQYNNTLAPIIIIHIFIDILSIFSVDSMIRQFEYTAFTYRDSSLTLYSMILLVKKFSFIRLVLVFSSIFLLCCSIFAHNTYGILVGYNALLIICVDILLDGRYDRIFIALYAGICMCRCDLVLRRPSRDLQGIATLFGNKFENDFHHIISETLKRYRIVSVTDDIINIIIEYIQPITDLEHNFIYRPCWTPSVVNNVDTESIQYLKQNKYGGIPYLMEYEEWPRCLGCDENMYLFLQLNMNTLPEEYVNKWLKQSDLYRNHLLQYFQCITPRCFKESSSILGSNIVRFIEIKHGTKYDTHWKQCLNEYNEFKQKRSIPLMENVITFWCKQQINRGIFDDDRKDENDGVYIFGKYVYETPSLAEYATFYAGIFDGTSMVGKEKFRHQNQIKTDKLYGYYCCLDQVSTDYDKIPICKVCNNYMNVMMYQLDGEHTGFQYPNGHIGAIFICDYHPFDPQLVLLTTTNDDQLER